MLNRKTTFVESYVQLLDTYTAIFLVTRACKKKLLLCTVSIANIIATYVVRYALKQFCHYLFLHDWSFVASLALAKCMYYLYC